MIDDPNLAPEQLPQQLTAIQQKLQELIDILSSLKAWRFLKQTKLLVGS